MQCEQTELRANHIGFDRCNFNATCFCWCPTWITAIKGMMHLCDRHAEIFQNAKNGAFYWGDKAKEAFALWTKLKLDPMFKRMAHEALQQARNRFKRSGKACFVYVGPPRSGEVNNVWYVVTEDEEQPKDALLYTIQRD